MYLHQLQKVSTRYKSVHALVQKVHQMVSYNFPGQHDKTVLSLFVQADSLPADTMQTYTISYRIYPFTTSYSFLGCIFKLLTLLRKIKNRNLNFIKTTNSNPVLLKTKNINLVLLILENHNLNFIKNQKL